MQRVAICHQSCLPGRQRRRSSRSRGWAGPFLVAALMAVGSDSAAGEVRLPAATAAPPSPLPPALAQAACHVFLIAGQSNAWGYLGENDEGLDEPVPTPKPGTVFFYDGKADAILDASAISKAVRGEYNGAAAGFLHRFAIDYHARTGKHVILIHKAPGNSGVVPGVAYGGGNWPDTYRAELKQKYAGFKARADADPRLAPRWALAGVIWAQGEAEVGLLESGQKTPQQVADALCALFDAFVEDYAVDYAGRPDDLIKTVLVSVYAYRSINSDRFYPDSPAWAASRQVQRDAAERHPRARMVYFATERFIRDGVWQPMNAVHYKQSQYNEIGRVIAQEIAQSGSTLKRPSPATASIAKADGPWRIDLRWAEPAGGLPGELPCYRIYRRKAGNDDAPWTWLWQHEGAAAPNVAFHDEDTLKPDTVYEYRIAARNEFGETLGEVVSARTGKLLADPLPAYQAMARPTDGAAVRAIWNNLIRGGHVRSLRSLHLLAAGLNAGEGPARNLVRGTEDADRYDLQVGDQVQREPPGCRFSGGATMTAPDGLLPLNGPMTLLLNFAWIEPPTDGNGVVILHQGAGYPFRDLDGVERKDRRTMLSYHPAGRLRIYQEVFQMFASAELPNPRIANTCALGYDGRWLTWHTPGAKPVTLSNDVYFLNVEHTPLVVGMSPPGAGGAFRLVSLAVWNRALDAHEVEAVGAILAPR